MKTARTAKPSKPSPYTNGQTTGHPCRYCREKDIIQPKTDAYFREFMENANAKSRIPYMEELQLEIGADDEVINDWWHKKTPSGELEHPELSVTLKKLKILQRVRLLQRTNGRFSPVGAIFQLKVNHGMIETEKRVLAGDSNVPLRFEIVEEGHDHGD